MKSRTGAVRKIDAYEKKLIFEDGTEIPVERIVRMDGEIFRGWGRAFVRTESIERWIVWNSQTGR